MQNNNNTVYLHRELGKGKVTVAAKLVGDVNGWNQYEMALAFCSPRDQFSRRVGRLIAEGRLRAGVAYGVVVCPSESLPQGLMRGVMEHRACYPEDFPTWAWG